MVQFQKKNTFSTSKWWSGGPDPYVDKVLEGLSDELLEMGLKGEF